MSRFIEFWEGYDIPVNDYINEYLGEEDVVLKGKYLFSTQKLKFSGKVKFNTAASGALETSGDYSLEHKPWNDSRYMFFHKSARGETTLDGHFWLAKNNNLNFQVYTRNTLTQTDEGRVNNTKLHFRTLHQNFIVSLGLENLNVFNLFNRSAAPADQGSKDTKEATPTSTSSLPNLGLWVLGGHRVDSTLALWGGLSLSFNPNRRNLDNARLLVAAYQNQSKVRGTVEGTFTRADSVDGKTSLWIPSVAAQFDCQALRGNRQLATVQYDHGKSTLRWNVANETQVDNSTRLKVRFNQANVLSLALVHSFSNLANFALTANVSHRAAREGKLGYLRYRFGSTLELLDV